MLAAVATVRKDGIEVCSQPIARPRIDSRQRVDKTCDSRS